MSSEKSKCIFKNLDGIQYCKLPPKDGMYCVMHMRFRSVVNTNQGIRKRDLPNSNTKLE